MFGALVLAASLARMTPAAEGAAGLWRTPEDGGSMVRIADCGDALCGWIVTSPRLSANPDQRDVRNRDAALRARPVRDLLVVKAKRLGRNQWGDGWLYDPIAGVTYKGVIELEDARTLRLTGCIVAPLCRSQTWRRAD